MSDCSTNAMQPKAHPRTCGTCGNGMQTNVFCRISDGSTAGLHSIAERACKRWVERPDAMCSCAKSRGFDELAEVAREISDWLFIWVETDPGHVITESDQADAREFRERLEKLGVIVDGD